MNEKGNKKFCSLFFHSLFAWCWQVRDMLFIICFCRKWWLYSTTEKLRTIHFDSFCYTSHLRVCARYSFHFHILAYKIECCLILIHSIDLINVNWLELLGMMISDRFSWCIPCFAEQWQSILFFLLSFYCWIDLLSRSSIYSNYEQHTNTNSLSRNFNWTAKITFGICWFTYVKFFSSSSFCHSNDDGFTVFDCYEKCRTIALFAVTWLFFGSNLNFNSQKKKFNKYNSGFYASFATRSLNFKRKNGDIK